MIYIKDDFLPLPLYKELVNFCDEFKEVKTPGKSFWVKELPLELTHYIEKSLEKLEGRDIKVYYVLLEKLSKVKTTSGVYTTTL